MWCLLLLSVRIPIQQVLHVLLTLGYKFVNDSVNWFLLPWLWGVAASFAARIGKRFACLVLTIDVYGNSQSGFFPSNHSGNI